MSSLPLSGPLDLGTIGEQVNIYKVGESATCFRKHY